LLDHSFFDRKIYIVSILFETFIELLNNFSKFVELLYSNVKKAVMLTVNELEELVNTLPRVVSSKHLLT